MLRGRFIVGLVTACLFTGCVGSVLDQPTTLQSQPQMAAHRTVLADLEREPDIITENYQPFFAAMARSLREEFQRTNLFGVVSRQRDLGPNPAMDPTVYTVYRIIDFSVVRDGNLAVRETVRITFELRVFNVAGRTPVQVTDPRSGSLAYMFDTVGLDPMLTLTHNTSLLAHLGHSNPEDSVAFSREMAADLVRQMLNLTTPDIARVVSAMPDSTAPAQPATPSQPTAPTQPATPSQPTAPAQPAEPSQPQAPAQTVQAGPENTPAACNDGSDNDSDSYIDCADQDCFSQPHCPQR